MRKKDSELLKNLTEQYLGKDLRKLALQKDKFKGIDFQFFIEQLHLLQRAKDKLPEFFHKRCLFSTKSYEQSTSQAVALYRSGLFKGRKMLDLTGGLGVDDWAFSMKYTNVISIDPDEELNELARHNFRLLGALNIERLTNDAESFLSKNKENFDLIYIDPDRRMSGRRVISLNDMKPDVMNLLPGLFERSKLVVIKLSPLFDITELFRRFGHLKAIYTIAEYNETKEVMVVMEKGHEGQVLQVAVNIEGDEIQSFQVLRKDDKNIQFSNKGKYFYEPNHALIKSELWQNYAKETGLKLLNEQSPFMISDILYKEYQGRSFEIINLLSYKPKELKSYFKGLSMVQANINRRNFPETVDEIRKQLKLKEGGHDYLFFTKTHENRLVCVHCRKLS